jgi:hypothetical protein
MICRGVSLQRASLWINFIRFSLDAMEKKACLRWSLDGVYNRRKLDDRDMDIGVNDMEGDARSESESGVEK